MKLRQPMIATCEACHAVVFLAEDDERRLCAWCEAQAYRRERRTWQRRLTR